MTSTEKSTSPGVEFLERYYESDPDDSGKENIESSMTIVTKKPWHCDGKGKYKEEFERLLYLVPESESRKSDTVSIYLAVNVDGYASDSNNSIPIVIAQVAGEIMRALVKLNRNCSALYNCLDALNYIAMAGNGIFDESNIHALATVHRVAQRPSDKCNSDEINKAIAQLNDSCLEFISKFPDLEWSENTTDLASLYKHGRNDFVERVISAHVKLTKAFPSSPPSKKQLHEITTPRTTNKMRCPISLRT